MQRYLRAKNRSPRGVTAMVTPAILTPASLSCAKGGDPPGPPVPGETPPVIKD